MTAVARGSFLLMEQRIAVKGAIVIETAGKYYHNAVQGQYLASSIGKCCLANILTGQVLASTG